MSQSWVYNLAHFVAFLLAVVHLALDITITNRSGQLIFPTTVWLPLDFMVITAVAVVWILSNHASFMHNTKPIVVVDLVAAGWYFYTMVMFYLATRKKVPRGSDTGTRDLEWVYSRLWQFLFFSAITGFIFIGEAITTPVLLTRIARVFVAAPAPAPGPVNIPLANFPPPPPSQPPALPPPIHLDLNHGP